MRDQKRTLFNQFNVTINSDRLYRNGKGGDITRTPARRRIVLPQQVGLRRPGRCVGDRRFSGRLPVQRNRFSALRDFVHACRGRIRLNGLPCGFFLHRIRIVTVFAVEESFARDVLNSDDMAAAMP